MKKLNKLVLAIWIVIGLTLVFVNNALAMANSKQEYTDKVKCY